MENRNVSGDLSGIFFSLITIVFIVLKLCGIITWSWWWILSPIWGPVILIFIVVFICAIVQNYYNL